MSDNPVKWTAAGLTPAGNALQAALLGTGDGLTFTRAAAADAEGVERLDLTLQSPCTVDDPKCRVPVLLTNAGVETAFTMTELRFYVRRVTDGAPTGEEMLYATVTDETGDPIPTAAQSPGFTIDWAFVFQYGNASEVTVTLDPVGLVSIGMVGQPNGVAALGENGAVPIAQGGTGATTAQAALAALGAMAADATGADIPVSSSDQTSISASLSNKVTQLGKLSAELFNDSTHPSGFFASVDDRDMTVPNIPAPGHWRLLYLPYFAASEGWATQIAVGAVENSGLCWRKAWGPEWQPWEFAVTATPPQVRNLTLQSGFSANGDCTFFVTQESVVFLAGGVSGTLPANQDTQIGALPADVSPAAQRRRPAVTDAGAAYIDIHTDGTVWAHPFSEASQFWFDTSFVAGGGS